MAHSINTKRISIHLLLCLLCVDFVFTATIETVQILESEEDEAISGENEDLLPSDFPPLTTRRKYLWDDWNDLTLPTLDYTNFDKRSDTFDIFLYVFLSIFAIAFVVAFYFICKRNMQKDNCFSWEPISFSSNTFITVNSPPERRSDFSAQVHGPPSARNLHNVTYVESPFASNSPSARQLESTVGEKPPDYFTATLSDPARPAFPVVQRDGESLPPHYGKENPFWK